MDTNRFWGGGGTIARVRNYILPPLPVQCRETTIQDVTFASLVRSIVRNRRLIIASILVFAVAAFVLTLYTPKMYVVSMRVTPPLNSPSNMDGGIQGGLGSILSGSRGGDVSFNNFIDLLHSNLVAEAINKDPRARRVVYGKSCCNTKRGLLAALKARAMAVFGITSVFGPSVPKTYDFLNSHISTLQDEKKSSLLGVSSGSVVTVSATMSHPEDAQYLLLETVRLADNILRNANRDDANQKVSYLRMRLATETVVEYRTALTNLLTEQEKRRMLVDASAYYSLFVLDSPVVNPIPYSPKPLLNLIIGAGLGLVLGMLFALFRDARYGLL